MTAQMTHGFEYQNEVWRLLQVSQDYDGHVLPPEFTLKTQSASTAGGPGYHIVCGLDGNQLIVRHFRVTGTVPREERADSGYQRDLRAVGSRTDWESERRWQVFPKLPSINGQLPEVRFFDVKSEPAHFLDPSETEGVDYSLYRDLNLPVNFTGGMLLGTDGMHGAWPIPGGYDRVLEMTFQDGTLTDLIDQSKLVQAIVAGAETWQTAIRDAMERRRDDLPHFKHLYSIFVTATFYYNG